jgi:hypothetical protein
MNKFMCASVCLLLLVLMLAAACTTYILYVVCMYGRI